MNKILIKKYADKINPLEIEKQLQINDAHNNFIVRPQPTDDQITIAALKAKYQRQLEYEMETF